MCIEILIPIQPLYSHSVKPKFIPARNSPKPLHLTLAKAKGSLGSASASKQSHTPPSFNNKETVFVGQEDVPLEGVIQYEKPNYSSFQMGRVALLAGSDLLALLLFSAIGKYNHGLPIFARDTLRTADPFMAVHTSLVVVGEDGRGANGLFKAVISAAKSWALGVPLGLVVRAATSGHIPPYPFVLLTMGSTSVLLIGVRAVLISLFPDETKKKNDVYWRVSPFELFELLTSLVRRW